MSPEEVTSALRTMRWPCGTEHALQNALLSFLDDYLSTKGVTIAAEYRLGPANRIDFFIEGGIGIEAKVKYPKRQIFRQLERYALCDEITSLILITGTAIGLPPEINGKPLFYVSLGRSAL